MTKHHEGAEKNEIDNLIKFFSSIENYPSPIPDEVIKRMMADSGIHVCDVPSVKMMNIYVQKFIYDVLDDSKKASSSRSSANKKRRDLQVCDIKEALERRGIYVNRPDFIISPLNKEEGDQ